VELYFHHFDFLDDSPQETLGIVSGTRPWEEQRIVGNRLTYDPDRKQDADKKYIMCLGDSFAFSWGVPETETFAVYLQLLFNGGRFKGEHGVINFGQPGTSIDRHAEVYRKIGRYPPHYDVLIVYGEDDVRSSAVSVMKQKTIGYAPPMIALSDWAAQSSALRPVINKVYNKTMTNVENEVTWDQARRVYEDYFRELVDDIRSHPARCAFVMVDPSRPDREFARELCVKYRVPYYQQEFSMTYDDSKYRFVDGHFNRFGNKRLAQEVHQFLVSLGWAAVESKR